MRSDIIDNLNKIDWEFSDFNSQLYPADINFIHWYPGVFVPQIPSILINALSEKGDLVLDPFSGSGITLIEAARIKRRFIGIDLNPFAINIISAKMMALTSIDDKWCVDEAVHISNLNASIDYSGSLETDSELTRWFHPDTLNQLLNIRKYISDNEDKPDNIIRIVLLSSILNRCSSQREHYTYITDKCFPELFINKDAFKIYLNQLDLLRRSIKESKNQYLRTFGSNWDFEGSKLQKGDSRDLSWIDSESVDLVVTSPPYLGVNDYARSMHLSSLLFQQDDFEYAITHEIGARRKRQRKSACDEYIRDMEANLSEVVRVLKVNKYLALIIGRGRGKVNTFDPIERLLLFLEKNGMEKVFEEQRRIKFRRIQVAGVGNEIIYVFRKC